MLRKLIFTSFIFLSFFSYSVFYCSRPAPVYLEENEVLIEHSQLVPESMTIVKGMTVTWINKDKIDHSVMSGTLEEPENHFAINPLKPGKKFTVTFDTVGNYLYYCKDYDKHLIGLIVVAEDTVVKDEID
jgi:plastocyanin